MTGSEEDTHRSVPENYSPAHPKPHADHMLVICTSTATPATMTKKLCEVVLLFSTTPLGVLSALPQGPSTVNNS